MTCERQRLKYLTHIEYSHRFGSGEFKYEYGFQKIHNSKFKVSLLSKDNLLTNQPVKQLELYLSKSTQMTIIHLRKEYVTTYCTNED